MKTQTIEKNQDWDLLECYEEEENEEPIYPEFDDRAQG